MAVKSYEDLVVWQKSICLCKEIYAISGTFPPHEINGLANQIRRAVVSIASNIAEGHARPSRADFLKFLGISSGSLAEVRTQMTIAIALGYVQQERVAYAIKLCSEISKMLYALSEKLKTPQR